MPCNITVSKDRDWLLMKQPNRKTKKRRLKDIHTIAKGYKSPFLRDLLHQPKEDLVLTLMLRRIKVLPLGLGEEVVEDSLDFLLFRALDIFYHYSFESTQLSLSFQYGNCVLWF